MAERENQKRTRPTRTKARKQALDILFEAEFRGNDVEQVLRDKMDEVDRPVRQYTSELIRGVEHHRDAIGARIRAQLSSDWTFERLPSVDRAALQLAAFEIDYCDTVPDAVAVSEAVGLVSELSTDESPTFVNGLLAAIVDSKAASQLG